MKNQRARSGWIWTFAGASVALLTSAHAEVGMNEVCPACALAATQQQQSLASDPLATPEAIPAFGTVSKLGFQVAPLTQQNRPFFPIPSIPSNPNLPTWNGVGELPGALKTSDFDPSFKTPFYDSSLGGLFNTALAPWNLFLPPEVASAWYGPMVTMPVRQTQVL